MSNGAQQACAALEGLGVSHVFGMPGTQNLHFFEQLRRSALRVVVPTHELAAGFMANGYYRACGRPGVLTTISGPGFAYTVAAIAEAAHDSAALLYLVEKGAPASARKFALQAIDQRTILSPLVKEIIEVDEARDVAPAVRQAYAATLSGEPGPVLLHVAREAMRGAAGKDRGGPPQADESALNIPEMEALLQRLGQSRRPLVFAGQGAVGAAAELLALAERWHAPVIATRSARGIIPENHRLAFVFEISAQGAEAFNGLLEQSDLVLALGCKLTHNGTIGFRLRIPREKLIHIDASEAVLNANYPASLAIRADAPAVIRELLRGTGPGSQWDPEDLMAWRRRAAVRSTVEPSVLGVPNETPGDFFAELRRVLPPDACLVTDSGLHQTLATRHFQVLAPRGYLLPSDFQSMGFGLPAAIAAKLAMPERKVAALIGDGGLLMSGMEIQTAVREQIPLTVMVFTDRALGQIRFEQLASYGEAFATDLMVPDLELFARSVGAGYTNLQRDGFPGIEKAIHGAGVTIVEVPLRDGRSMRRERLLGKLRSAARGARVPEMIRFIRGGSSKSLL